MASNATQTFVFAQLKGADSSEKQLYPWVFVCDGVSSALPCQMQTPVYLRQVMPPHVPFVEHEVIILVSFVT